MFSEKLKDLREQHGYSIPKFVKAYNTKYCTKLSIEKAREIEKGIRPVRMIVVENIADFFKISVDELLK